MWSCGVCVEPFSIALSAFEAMAQAIAARVKRFEGGFKGISWSFEVVGGGLAGVSAANTVLECGGKVGLTNRMV